MVQCHITASLDPTRSEIVAKAAFHLDGETPTGELTLQLNPNLRVTRVWLQGDECGFSQAEDGRVVIGLPASVAEAQPALKITAETQRAQRKPRKSSVPSAPLRCDSHPPQRRSAAWESVLEVAYEGRLAQVDAAGEQARAFINEDFFWLRDDQFWFPALADRQEEMLPVPPGRYVVQLHLPAGWEAAASAPLIRRWQEGSCECYRWDTQSEYPGMSVVGGQLHRYATGKCTFLWSAPRPDQAEVVLGALGFCEALLGPRPCADLTVVLGPGYVPGGYADCGLIYVGENRLTARTLAHELVHQWWGRGVWAKHHGDRWITEGLAGYLALLYAEARGESLLSETLEQYREDYRQAVATWGDKPLAEVGSADYERAGLVSALIYKKGVWLHRTLHLLLAEQYFPALRDIGARYCGRSIATAQYIAELADACPAQREAIAAFAQQWLAAPGLPGLTNQVGESSEPPDQE